VSCHGGAHPSGKTDLSGYDQLVHNTQHTDLVTPGKPENSHLYEMVQNGEMPPGGPALSTTEVQAVSDWITAGAPNN